MRALERRFDTGYIDNLAPNEIIVKKGDTRLGNDRRLRADGPVMFGNLFLTMQFKKTVVIN